MTIVKASSQRYENAMTTWWRNPSSNMFSIAQENTRQAREETCRRWSQVWWNQETARCHKTRMATVQLQVYTGKKKVDLDKPTNILSTVCYRLGIPDRGRASMARYQNVSARIRNNPERSNVQTCPCKKRKQKRQHRYLNHLFAWVPLISWLVKTFPLYLTLP
jgi:hypothetical protein